MSHTPWNLVINCIFGKIKGWLSKRVVLADVPPERKPERGYIRMFPHNENRSKGTFACSLGTKTGTRVHSPKPPFYETALLSLNHPKNLLRLILGDNRPEVKITRKLRNNPENGQFSRVLQCIF